MGITLGYEDLNDHDQLRHDPVLALLSGKLEGHRKDCAPLAGKSTLNRLEHAPPSGEPGRYHSGSAMMRTRCRPCCSSRSSTLGRAGGRRAWCSTSTRPTTRIHGRQEGRFFHGYYGHYCFLPLYITCGGRPLFAQLRPGNADPAGGVTGPLGRIVERLRERWPGLEILLRADASYAREEILAWCEGNGVDYVIGLARNSRLVEKIGWELADAQAEAKRRVPPSPPVQGVPLRHTHKLVPQAPGRRQGRAPARQGQPALRGHLAARHLLGPDRLRARLLPEGQHGEHDQGAAARSLLRPDLGVALRRQPAPDPLLRLRLDPLRCAQACAARHPPGPRHRRNARLKLLKIGARVTVSVRRVKVAMDSAHPSAAAFARVHARLPG